MVHSITKIPYNMQYGHICSLVSRNCSAQLIEHMSLPARPSQNKHFTMLYLLLPDSDNSILKDKHRLQKT